jgi:YfiH family protein
MTVGVWREDAAGVRTLHFPALERLGVRAYFTGRAGGVSQPPYASLNWSISVGDNPAHVRQNRRRALAPAGVTPAEAAIAGLVHGVDVARVDRLAPDESGITLVPGVDGLVTDRPGVALIITAADCVPVYLVDPVRRAIGLAHAGWRGTMGDMAGALVRALTHHYGSRPADLVAAVGPSIGPCCYEVDRPVHDAAVGQYGQAAAAFFHPGRDAEHWQLDLWAANRHALERAGVPAAQVHVGGVCTSCQRRDLFSHRADGGRTGRGAAVLLLEQESPGT